MKILLDCIVTAADPAKCSSNIQFLTFVKRTLQKRDDVFFYWLIPEWIVQKDFLETYPQDPRVSYITAPQHKDRTKEYLTLGKALDDAVGFNGGMWDWDVLFTVRAGLASVLKMLATSPRSFKQSWMKQVWLLEAMVLMEFKRTVLTFEEDTQDLFTLTGYLAADHVFLTSQIDRTPILRRAQELLAPSRARKLPDKIVTVGYGQFVETQLKTPDQFPDPANGKPLCIAHAGRMEKANRIEEINSVMTKAFVLKGDRVKLLVCTVSSGPKTFDTDVIDVKTASREEFWRLAKTEMHVIINMSDEVGSALSLLEPMMFGVPGIIGPRQKVEDALGKDYPFVVSNEVEAFAYAKMFYDDYAGMYERFAKWAKEKFEPMMKYRMDEQSIYTRLDNAVAAFDATRLRISEDHPTWAKNGFVADILAHVGDAQEFVLEDVVKDMVEQKKADKKMLDKLQPGDRDTRGLVWSTDFNRVRRTLQTFHGWEDASVKVGHFRRASC